MRKVNLRELNDVPKVQQLIMAVRSASWQSSPYSSHHITQSDYIGTVVPVTTREIPNAQHDNEALGLCAPQAACPVSPYCSTPLQGRYYQHHMLPPSSHWLLFLPGKPFLFLLTLSELNPHDPAPFTPFLFNDTSLTLCSNPLSANAC
jgi:hypothetical protein